MPSRPINLVFPLGGLDRRMAYQAQPPFTTPDCLNVRSQSPLDGREQGGSRPGLVKAFPGQLGDGAPINMLAEVRTLLKNPTEPLGQDLLLGSAPFGPEWSQASDFGWRPDEILHQDSLAYLAGPAVKSGALIHEDIGLDHTQGHRITILAKEISAEQPLPQWSASIIIGLDVDNPDLTRDGIEFRLRQVVQPNNTRDVFAELFITVNGSTTYPDPPDPVNIFTDWVRPSLRFSGSGNSVTCSWDHPGRIGIEPFTNIPTGPLVGPRWGFGVEWLNEGRESERANVDWVQWSQWHRPGGPPDLNRNFLVANSGSTLYRDTIDGEAMRPVANQQETLSSDRRLFSAQHGGDLWIADWGKTDAQVRPKRYSPDSNGDPDQDGLFEWTGSPGTIPKNNRAIALYHDRIVLAGREETPHLWFMSAQGEPRNWSFGGSDPGGAIEGSASDAGALAQPIRALIPFSNDWLIFGCSDSIWKMHGDPGFGGYLDNVTYAHGVIDQGAWCYGPKAEVFFLSRDGLYRLPPGEDSEPQSLSREKLPRELLDVDRNTTMVSMAYDSRFNGVHIYLTKIIRSGGTIHFWYDVSGRSFWPVTHSIDLHPWTSLAHNADLPPENHVLFGGRDGYIRRYDFDAAGDDGVAFDNFAMYGPILLGRTGAHEGMLTELNGVSAERSGPVNFDVQVGDSVERALASTSRASGTWNGGPNHTNRVRARGNAMFIKLSGSDGQPWAIEQITAKVKTTGRQKLA